MTAPYIHALDKGETGQIPLGLRLAMRNRDESRKGRQADGTSGAARPNGAVPEVPLNVQRCVGLVTGRERLTRRKGTWTRRRSGRAGRGCAADPLAQRLALHLERLVLRQELEGVIHPQGRGEMTKRVRPAGKSRPVAAAATTSSISKGRKTIIPANPGYSLSSPRAWAELIRSTRLMLW